MKHIDHHDYHDMHPDDAEDPLHAEGMPHGSIVYGKEFEIDDYDDTVKQFLSLGRSKPKFSLGTMRVVYTLMNNLPIIIWPECLIQYDAFAALPIEKLITHKPMKRK